jgi:hypothetical protein
MDIKAAHALCAKVENSHTAECGCSPRSRGLFQSLAAEGSSVWTRISEQLQPNLRATVSMRSNAERTVEGALCLQHLERMIYR